MSRSGAVDLATWRAKRQAREVVAHDLEEIRHLLGLHCRAVARGEPVDPEILEELASYLETMADEMRKASEVLGRGAR
jgi:hypothetical protein